MMLEDALIPVIKINIFRHAKRVLHLCVAPTARRTSKAQGWSMMLCGVVFMLVRATHWQSHQWV